MSNAQQNSWMIYGAYGVTGRLIVEEALRRGHRPVLAGRDAARLKAMAAPLGLEISAFPLADPLALVAATASVALMVNAAGPFTETGPRIIDACLRTGTGYLDIS